MKKIVISEAQKKAIESQQEPTVVVTVLSVDTLVAAQVLNVLTEAEGEETSQSNN